MPGKEIQRESLSVLIAENDSKKRLALVMMLHELGYKNITQADDGTAAFHALKRRSIDFIFSAIKMPQMNGLALLKVLYSDYELSNIPLVFLTSAITKEIVREVGRYGANGILLEPVKKEALDEKIESALAGPADEESKEVENKFETAKKLTEEGKYDEALKLYKDALEVHEDAEIYVNIGVIMSTQGRYEDAIIAFRKAVMINNMHAHAFKAMGEVFIKKGQPDEAEKYFQKAGDIFLERQQDTEAEEAFNEVLKINPDTTNVYNSLGILHRKRRNFTEAINAYKNALKVDPKDENIYYNLGRALLEGKRIEEAKKAFSYALKINPSFEEAKRMLQAIEVRLK